MYSFSRVEEKLGGRLSLKPGMHFNRKCLGCGENFLSYIEHFSINCKSFLVREIGTCVSCKGPAYEYDGCEEGCDAEIVINSKVFEIISFEKIEKEQIAAETKEDELEKVKIERLEELGFKVLSTSMIRARCSGGKDHYCNNWFMTRTGLCDRKHTLLHRLGKCNKCPSFWYEGQTSCTGKDCEGELLLDEENFIKI